VSGHGRSGGSSEKRIADEKISIIGGEHEKEETI
jgi:hypothetical protein